MNRSDIVNRRAALIVGHPGHELRIHGWLELAKPEVFVLTTGSGKTGTPRIESTSRVLREAECRSSSIFGAFSDQEIYAALLAHRFEPFVGLVETMVERLRALDVDYVVGDAYEGFSATHDLCRIMTGAAVERLRSEGREVGNFDFLLEGRPDVCDIPEEQGSLRLELSQDAFERKIAAARCYQELADEVDSADRLFGLDAFRSEWLRPVATTYGLIQPSSYVPMYEQFGNDRVAAGKYRQVLRYQKHFQPLAQALWEYATGYSRVSFQRVVVPAAMVASQEGL